LIKKKLYDIMFIEGKGKGCNRKKEFKKNLKKHLTGQKLYDIMYMEDKRKGKCKNGTNRNSKKSR
jgi:hypothetical protein